MDLLKSLIILLSYAKISSHVLKIFSKFFPQVAADQVIRGSRVEPRRASPELFFMFSELQRGLVGLQIELVLVDVGAIPAQSFKT